MELVDEEQDEFAFQSQQKMARAMEEGRFEEQIVPISIPVRKGEPIVFKMDEHPRPETTKEALAKLPAVFLEGGTVTAGSSSGLNDAASAVVIMSREKANELGITPLAIFVHMQLRAWIRTLWALVPFQLQKKYWKKRVFH